MYLNTTVKIPVIKGKIITKKKGNVTYILYQYDSEYNQEKQYAVPKRAIVGKVSGDDSTMMVPNEKFQIYFPDAEIPEDMSDLLDFMKALYRKAKSGGNVAELLDEAAGKELYNGVELETLINLFTCTVKDEIVQIPGDRSGEDGSDGFQVDRDGMTELLLKLFYDETMEEN